MYQDLTTQVYNRIKEMIYSGELSPGQKLVQEVLSRELGVSRTPLLQAISKLVRDRLVVSIPRKGSYVRTISNEEIIDVFRVRCALEPVGAELAAGNITEEEIDHLREILEEMSTVLDTGDRERMRILDCSFHLAIMYYSGNFYLYDYLRSLITTMFSYEYLLKTPEESFRNHREILKCLERHDPYGAKTAMIYHLNEGSAGRLAEMLEETHPEN